MRAWATLTGVPQCPSWWVARAHTDPVLVYDGFDCTFDEGMTAEQAIVAGQVESQR